ncbi:class I SAM-dependent methyltransferase [Caulobacter sp. KR2-114]|uniref:class I SAM-dependent methyltransferase n=1 Tax=Caulobacter sp. KR2-114 TaxID=3400912 RepID=UPI003C116952
MQAGQPSLTARRAAAHRALHQSLDGARVFADPLAPVILGDDPVAVLGGDADSPGRRGMRWFIAARSRFAEDALAAAVARGVRQYVVLGAGLDTFACRNPHAADGLAVFEVDHPATQAWKRARLAEAGLTPAAGAVFAPVDFERQTLAEGLAGAGFDAARPAFFSWLGVTPYLTREAIFQTLGFIAGVPAAEVVFDHGEPSSAYRGEAAVARQARAAGVAALGEPWITHFEPPALRRDLLALGFTEIEDLGPGQIGPRYFDRPGRDGPGPHAVRARRA